MASLLLISIFDFSACEYWTRAICHLCNEAKGIKLIISILITSPEIIYSLRSCFRIEEANYDGSCRRLVNALYTRAPRYLIFYNNMFYWGDNRLHHKNYIWQTNRTLGDTKWFDFSVKRVVDSGIITEGRNGNLKTIFSTSGQTTLNWKYLAKMFMWCLMNVQFRLFFLNLGRISYTENMP